MKSFILKNRNAFENAVFVRLMAFGGLSLFLTFFAAFKTPLISLGLNLHENLWSMVQALSATPQSLLAGTVGLVFLFVHQRYWATSTWRFKNENSAREYVCVSSDPKYARWTAPVSVVVYLTFAFVSFNLAYRFNTNGWVTSLLGVSALVFVGLVARHQGAMNDWRYREKDTHEAGTSWLASLIVGCGSTLGFTIQFSERQEAAFFAAAGLGVACAVSYLAALALLALPRISPAIVSKEDAPSTSSTVIEATSEGTRA